MHTTNKSYIICLQDIDIWNIYYLQKYIVITYKLQTDYIQSVYILHTNIYWFSQHTSQLKNWSK